MLDESIELLYSNAFCTYIIAMDFINVMKYDTVIDLIWESGSQNELSPK
jgi:hypothetical protein